MKNRTGSRNPKYNGNDVCPGWYLVGLPQEEQTILCCQLFGSWYLGAHRNSIFP